MSNTSVLDPTGLPLLLSDFVAQGFMQIARITVPTDVTALSVGDAGLVFLSSTGDITIRGVSGGSEGKLLWLWAPGRAIILRPLDAAARPEHRIRTSYGTPARANKALLVYNGYDRVWDLAYYEPSNRASRDYVESSTSVSIGPNPNAEVYANLLWGATVNVPDGHTAILFSVGSARLFSGAPAACQIAFHSGGSAYRSVPIYSDSNSVIAVSHTMAFAGPTTVTPELVGVTPPRSTPAAVFERRSLSTLVIFL